MPENGKEGEVVVMQITINLDTGELGFNAPSNFVMALGMLEAAREMLMMNRVRPAFAPQVVGAGKGPIQIVRGN